MGPGPDRRGLRVLLRRGEPAAHRAGGDAPPRGSEGPGATGRRPTAVSFSRGLLPRRGFRGGDLIRPALLPALAAEAPRAHHRVRMGAPLCRRTRLLAD